MLKLTFVPFIVICLATIGCRTTNTSSVAKVVGGQPVNSGEFQSTVQTFGSCTAVKIGPKLFLTAAHCAMDPRSGLRVNELLDIEYRSLSSQKNHRPRVTSIDVFPGYVHDARGTEEYLSNFDIAVFRVDQTTPGFDVSPVSFEPIQVNDRVILAGYGCEVDRHDRTWDQYGVLKTVENRVSRLFSGVFTTPRTDDSNDPARLCSGDSGGPTFLANGSSNPPVVGINAWRSQDSVPYASAMTRIDSDTDWQGTSVATWLSAHISSDAGSPTVDEEEEPTTWDTFRPVTPDFDPGFSGDVEEDTDEGDSWNPDFINPGPGDFDPGFNGE
jgi:hypothetical protein